MKNKEKQLSENVIVDNILKYIKKNDLSYKQFALDINIDTSLPSKWKNGTSSPTIDHIKQTAIYFGITVNDLYYSEEEKKKIEVLTDKSYSPIMAQHSIDVEIYEGLFSKPFRIVLFSLIVLIFFSLLLYPMGEMFIYSPLVIFVFVFVVFKEVRESSIREENFIINYLDDICYKRETVSNSFYLKDILIKIVSIFSVAFCMSIAPVTSDTNDISYGLSISLLLLSFFQIMQTIIAVLETPRKYELEIYEDDFKPYRQSRSILIYHCAIFSITLLFCIYSLQQYFILPLVSLAILILNSYSFIKVTKEYNKYVLVYKEENKEPRVLFQK